MKIGIIGALKEEVKLILDMMLRYETESILGINFYYGSICNNKVVVVECSIGKVNAAICATLMIDKYNPDIIINTGIAGALSGNLEIMDTVIAESVHFHDQNEVFEKYYPFRRYFECCSDLIKMCINICETVAINNIYIGKIATGDIYVDSDEKKQNIIKIVPDVMCVEMEGAAIGQVCFEAGKKFLMIRTISDEANENADNNYDIFMKNAAEKSASIILNLVREL